ncbi:MAG TPA: RNA polymerase sigma factor [Candidatus Acidoferrum sp.]|nr:RNA polymerase sigma factor [Candidatus Acidoferrum sp.]
MNPENGNYEQVVNAHYQNLYRFALTLTRSESDASDLTQSAFERLLRKPDQLRDPSKAKTWLFTTLYRLFLEQRRHEQRFPHVTVEDVELPSADTNGGNIDAGAVTTALAQIEEPFRAVLVLFYLEDHSYREIAEILDVPIGTVMSRLSRGKAMLRALLDEHASKIVPLPLKAAS